MGSPSLKLARFALYFAWTVSLLPAQLVGLVFRCRWTSTLPVFYHRCCCRILGLHIRVIGSPTIRRPVLFAANHVSYTDITVLGAVIPGSFIAKAEVANWPFFGWLAKLQRSVFVDRRARNTAVHRDAIRGRLDSGDALILFPEGTSGDGNRVLPFRSALFAAAQHAAGSPPVIVQPVSLAYTRLDGMPIGRFYRPLFAWHGAADLASHMWVMAGLGAVEVVVEFHPPTFLADCGSRKALAAYCHARVSGGVAAALFGRPQPVPEPPRPVGRDPVSMPITQAAVG
jgi:1-acyl-sn-glycerol-3-phosphate acyltransferase